MAKIKGEPKTETEKKHDSPKRKISTSSKNKSWWNQKEEHRLLALVSRWKKKKSSKLNDECWEVIALHMVNENGETMGKTAARCKSRYKKIKKEDAMIVAFYKKHEASGTKFDRNFFRSEGFQAFSKRIPERTPLYLHRRYAELAEKYASWTKKTKKHRKNAYVTEAETRQDASPVIMRESQLEERNCTMKECMYVNNMDTQLDGRQIHYNPPPYNNYKNHEYDINPNDFIESYPQNLEYNYPPFEHAHYDHAATAYEPAIGGNISEPAPSQHHEQVNNMIRMTPSKKFPQNLHLLLDEGSYSSIISWQPHGRSFRIHKKEEFVRDVLPKYFKLNKLSSIYRQLSHYGFKRQQDEGPDKGGYYHKHFLRGQYELTSSLKSRRAKVSPFDNEYEDGKEPPFYKMKPMPPAELAEEMTPPHDHQYWDMFPISRLEQKEKVLWSPKLDKEASMDDHTFELGELSDETLFESLNQDFSI